MARSAIGLLRDSGRIFLEAAPRGIDPGLLLVAPDRDCHERREVVRHLLETGYGITHQIVQIEHREQVQGLPTPTYRAPDPAARADDPAAAARRGH